MKIKKVNKFLNFFLYRYFAILLLCLFTYLITGKIADMDFYTYDFSKALNLFADLGGRNKLAINIFSALNLIVLSRIGLVVIMAAISSFITYFLSNNHIDKNNFRYWALLLICPGIIIYTNAPSKEILFFFPAMVYVILESNFLLSKWKNNIQNFINLILKFSILYFLFFMRSLLALPYLLVASISLLTKVFFIGKYTKKISLRTILLLTFISSIVLVYIINSFDSSLFSEQVVYAQGSFSAETPSRTFINYEFIINPLNFLSIQYLALFPSLEELIDKPYQIVIVIESVILVYLFFNIWRNLFYTSRKDNNAKKIILTFFTCISISYFILYGILGSFNLGSSQRFRVNFLPIAIVFPIILEIKIRTKHIKKSENLEKNYPKIY